MAKAKQYSAFERLCFPKYGEIGFEDQSPVGRKHLNSKLSAIHKIIFNEESKLPPRRIYNQSKLNLKDESNQYSSLKSLQKSSRYNRNQSLQQYAKIDKEISHKYDLMQRQSILNNQNDAQLSHKYDFVQRQSQQMLGKQSNKRHFSPQNDRLDSLDKIIDPYKNYHAVVRRRKSYHQNQLYSQADKQKTDQIYQDNEYPEYASLSRKEGVISPTFLNSLL